MKIKAASCQNKLPLTGNGLTCCTETNLEQSQARTREESAGCLPCLSAAAAI